MDNDHPHDGLEGTGLEDVFRPWWTRRGARWVGGLLIVLTLAGLLGARPAWRLIKRYRAESMVREARTLLTEGKVVPALDRASAALQLVPEHPDGLRLMARGLARTSSSRGALGYWERVMRNAGSNDADRLEFSEVAVREGLLEVAGPSVRQLMAATNPTPRVLRLAANYHESLNHTAEALRLVRIAVAAEPDNSTNRIALARLLSTRPDAASQEEARLVFWKIIRDASSQRLEALEHLVNGPPGVRKDREDIVALLGALPNPGVAEIVIHAEGRMRLDPSLSRAIATEVLGRISNLSDADLRTVAAWLQRHNMPDLVLGLISPNRARTSQWLYGLRVDALADSGRVEAAYRELLQIEKGIDPLDLELWRFRAARKLKDEAAAERHRQQLLRAAGADAWRIRRIAEFSQQNLMRDLAAEAWKKLVNDRFESQRALRALSVLADAEGDTWAARDYLRRLAKLDPGDKSVALAVMNYDLLVGERVEETTRAAEALLSDAELEGRARFVVALGYLRLGVPERSRPLLASAMITLARGTVAPSQRAVLAAVLGSTGDKDGARRVARGIPLSQLRPEERDLIRSYVIPEALTTTPE